MEGSNFRRREEAGWIPEASGKEEKTKDLGQSRDSRNPRHSVGASKETTVSQFLTTEVFWVFFSSKLTIYFKICIIVGNNSS